MHVSSHKKLNLPPLKILEHPDKKLNSPGIILSPWDNLKLLEKYQPPSSQKNHNLQEKHHSL